MKKLISCCSSRIRPDRIQEMLNSFIQTRTFAELIVYIDEKDPRIEEYKEVIKKFECPFIRFIIGEHKYMVGVVNYISTEVEPNADYYQNICDDHIYLKKGWDELMLKPLIENNDWGISFVLDEKDPSENPTAEIMSGKIVRALGYFYFPQFRQYGEELYIAQLGIAGYFFIGRDLIEHKHPVFGKAERDANHDFVYSREEAENRSKAQIAWEQSKDIEKIKEAMKKEGIKPLVLQGAILEGIRKYY